MKLYICELIKYKEHLESSKCCKCKKISSCIQIVYGELKNYRISGKSVYQSGCNYYSFKGFHWNKELFRKVNVKSLSSEIKLEIFKNICNLKDTSSVEWSESYY